MCKLKLVEASKEYEKQAMEYKNDFIFHGEKLINGSSGFIDYQDYDEWLRRIETEKIKKATREDTPSTTYFTIRKDDNKIKKSSS